MNRHQLQIQSRLSVIVSALLLVSLAACTKEDPTSPTPSQTPASSSWTGFHGGRKQTGFANVDGPSTATLQWKLLLKDQEQTNGSAGSIVVASDGTLIVAAYHQFLAISPKGAILWRKSFELANGPTLSADEQTIYGLTKKAIVALDRDGNEKWRYATEGDTFFAPVVGADGTIYRGAWDGYLYALNPDGSLKWRYKTDGCLTYPVTIDDAGTIYQGGGDAHCGGDPHLYALNSDGTLKWKLKTGDQTLRVGTPSVLPDGSLTVPASPALLKVTADGETIWQLGDSQSLMAGIISPAIAADGRITIGLQSGEVLALDPTTQAVLWRYQTGPDPEQPNFYGVIGFPVVDRNGTTYVGAVDGNMYALSRDGELLWRFQTGARMPEASPAFGSDGTLYFTSDDGYLYAVGE